MEINILDRQTFIDELYTYENITESEINKIIKAINHIYDKYPLSGSLDMTLYMNPEPYKRHRARNKFSTSFYDPNGKYKSYLKENILAKLPKEFKLINGEVQLYIDFYLPQNKDVQNSIVKYLLHQILLWQPLTRPDLDNYLKPVMDAMNKLVWKDDGQVTRIYTNKYISDSPRIEISLRYRQEEIKLR